MSKETNKTLLSREHEALAIDQLQRLAQERFDARLGQFEAKEWLDELSKIIGAHFYNQALAGKSEDRRSRRDDRQRHLGASKVARAYPQRSRSSRRSALQGDKPKAPRGILAESIKTALKRGSG